MAGGAAPRRLREAAAAAALTSGARTTFRASLARLLPAAGRGSGALEAGATAARPRYRHNPAAIDAATQSMRPCCSRGTAE